MKLVKLSSKSDKYNIDKELDETDRIDMIYDKKYDKIDQIGEKQENYIYLE